MRLERQPSGEIEVYELDVIADELRRFGGLLEQVLGDQRKDRTERERYKFLLMAVAHLLRGIGAPRAFANEYVKLASYMLEDLDAGKAHPILVPEPITGPPEPPLTG